MLGDAIMDDMTTSLSPSKASLSLSPPPSLHSTHASYQKLQYLSTCVYVKWGCFARAVFLFGETASLGRETEGENVSVAADGSPGRRNFERAGLREGSFSSCCLGEGWWVVSV